MKISYDCILIDGCCVMKEAILIEESVLIKHLRNYSNSNQPIKALVYQTGFQEDQLDKYYFKVNQFFSFQRDSLKYLLVLDFLEFINFSISLDSDFSNDETIKEAIINALKLITIIIPPALPSTLTAGVFLAMNRLQRQKIQCIKPDQVNTVKVNICAFDQTGTLTELDLDVVGFRPIK